MALVAVDDPEAPPDGDVTGALGDDFEVNEVLAASTCEEGRGISISTGGWVSIWPKDPAAHLHVLVSCFRFAFAIGVQRLNGIFTIRVGDFHVGVADGLVFAVDTGAEDTCILGRDKLDVVG